MVTVNMFDGGNVIYPEATRWDFESCDGIIMVAIYKDGTELEVLAWHAAATVRMISLGIKS